MGLETPPARERLILFGIHILLWILLLQPDLKDAHDTEPYVPPRSAWGGLPQKGEEISANV